MEVEEEGSIAACSAGFRGRMSAAEEGGGEEGEEATLSACMGQAGGGASGCAEAEVEAMGESAAVLEGGSHLGMLLTSLSVLSCAAYGSAAVGDAGFEWC